MTPSVLKRNKISSAVAGFEYSPGYVDSMACSEASYRRGGTEHIV